MNYNPPLFLFNPHLETIYPALFRRVSLPAYQRERIETPDQDFLDLDWVTQQSKKLVIISHGLEGNTQRSYMKGMAKACFQAGFDVLAWNYRGCSEEMNRQLRFYHSGATDDLDVVIGHALKKDYEAINLIGFSLGGNITLKYLGEDRQRSALIRKAIAFSVPLDLNTSCDKISQPSNWVYSRRFIRSLKEKIVRKSKQMNGLNVNGIARIKTLREFDDAFTGPLHGFTDADDYYAKCSSIQVVGNITLPTLLINAINDPFLSAECYPHEQLKNHPQVRFLSPAHGGHVGFSQFGSKGLYWSEQQAVAFLKND